MTTESVCASENWMILYSITPPEGMKGVNTSIENFQFPCIEIFGPYATKSEAEAVWKEFEQNWKTLDKTHIVHKFHNQNNPIGTTTLRMTIKAKNATKCDQMV